MFLVLFFAACYFINGTFYAFKMLIRSFCVSIYFLVHVKDLES